MESKLKRRSFFELIGKGAIGIMLLNAIPFKSLFAKKRNNSEIKIEIHPNAVSRNKKGLAG